MADEMYTMSSNSYGSLFANKLDTSDVRLFLHPLYHVLDVIE